MWSKACPTAIPSSEGPHFAGRGAYKHTIFPRQEGGRAVLVCLPGDDRPRGLANKSVRDRMGELG